MRIHAIALSLLILFGATLAQQVTNECISGPIGATCDFSLVEEPKHPALNYPKAKENRLYNVWKCPDVPPKSYPIQWSAKTILSSWLPNETVIPEQIHQGLCYFDFETDVNKAWNYLENDKPFVMRNTLDFVAAAKRWDQPSYLETLLGNTNYTVHASSSHQFMYWTRKQHPPENWTEPTRVLRIPYHEYLNLKSHPSKANETHFYLYAEGYWSIAPGEEHYNFPLFNELERFKPGQPPELFMENFDAKGPPGMSSYQKLHCKFGQAGNMAVMHFDSDRNTIVLLKGQRRYLLADPSQCVKLSLYQSNHPSSRHTSIDFDNFPQDNDLYMNEVVMNPGDALVLPSYWFHSIIGLSEETAQCNVWSIPTLTHKAYIEKCGEFAISNNDKERVEGDSVNDATDK